MSNEYVTAIVFAVWLLRGLKFDLSLCIFIYYALYMLSELSLNYPLAYYSIQSTIDLFIIALCLIVGLKYSELAHTCFLYSLVVFSSLSFELLTVFNGVEFSESAREVYNYRQEFSHTFDLIFAIAGSGKRGFITDAYLFILHFLRYTRDLWNKFIN